MQLSTGLQFDIYYVIKTRVGFEITKITRFLNYLAAIHWLIKIVINLKISVKCETNNVEFLRRDLLLNNSAIMVK